MSVAANTPECFQEFLGQRVIGILERTGNYSFWPGSTVRTLIFEDGRGLAFTSHSYWIESKKDVMAAISREAAKLDQTKQRIEGVLDLTDNIVPLYSSAAVASLHCGNEGEGR